PVEYFLRDALGWPHLLAVPHPLRVLEIDPPGSLVRKYFTHRTLPTDFRGSFSLPRSAILVCLSLGPDAEPSICSLAFAAATAFTLMSSACLRYQRRWCRTLLQRFEHAGWSLRRAQ